MKIIYSSSTNKGRRRENQDRIFINEKGLPAFAVFDGMGGEQRGKTASSIACQTFEEFFEKKKPSQICTLINQRICEYMKLNQIFRMGTTAAIVEFSDEFVYTCNIGDSRIYRIADNEIEQLSVDHVINTGRFKTRRVLAQYLGIPKNEIEIEPHIETHAVKPGDIYLVCSDGLTDMVTDETIKDIILKSKTENTAEKLVQTALTNGGRDNISVIVCEVTN